MMKIYKQDIKLLILTIIIISLVKAPFIEDSSVDLYDNLHSFYIYYGEDMMFNTIWLTPLLATLFFITKSIYIKIMNFNIRYKNRKAAIRNILFQLYGYGIVFILLSLVIQLPLFILNTSYGVEFELRIIIFVFKYCIELMSASTVIIVVAVFLKNYTYSFVIVCSLLLLLLTGYQSYYFPLVSLYVNDNINLLSILIQLGMIFILYNNYLKTDVLGGRNK